MWVPHHVAQGAVLLAGCVLPSGLPTTTAVGQTGISVAHAIRSAHDGAIWGWAAAVVASASAVDAAGYISPDCKKTA
jgi:hypothetical protein